MSAAKKNLRREEFEQLISSGKPENISKALEIYDSMSHKLSKRYGLVFEEGNDEEGGYDAEGVIVDLATHIPVPHHRPDLSMTREQASRIIAAGGGVR